MRFKRVFPAPENLSLSITFVICMRFLCILHGWIEKKGYVMGKAYERINNKGEVFGACRKEGTEVIAEREGIGFKFFFLSFFLSCSDSLFLVKIQRGKLGLAL